MNDAYRENYKQIKWALPEPPEPKCEMTVARSHLPAPMLIRDEMDPVQSQLDGKMYDSKSSLRRTYKAAGVNEVGNDLPATPPPAPRKSVKRNEVEASVGKALSRAGFGA